MSVQAGDFVYYMTITFHSHRSLQLLIFMNGGKGLMDNIYNKKHYMQSFE